MPQDQATDRDEFYVGYLPNAPAGVGARVRVVVMVLATVLTIGGAALAWAFRSPGAATWSDQVSEHVGRVIERPYPMLRLTDPQGRPQRALLGSSGKHGAGDRVRGLDGAQARVRGTVLQRDGRLIIELADDEQAVAKSDAAPSPSAAGEPARQLGRRTLAGEIIDPKCFFGAMKPGDGKLHKACAIRCISGGIPPMLAVRDADDARSYYLLASADGGVLNKRVLPFIAEAVEIAGELEEADGQQILRVDDDPGAIRRAESNP